MQQHVSSNERMLPDTTTVIGMLWVGATVYERLWALAIPLTTPTVGWCASIITLLVAWALMSRKRWARLALLGMASLAAASALWSLASYLSIPGGFALPYRMPPALASAIPGEGEHSAMMAASFLGISVLTLGWLARTRVRSEFDMRKAAALHSYQIGIAAALVILWVSGEVVANRWPDHMSGPRAMTAPTALRIAHLPLPHRMAWLHQDGSRETN